MKILNYAAGDNDYYRPILHVRYILRNRWGKPRSKSINSSAVSSLEKKTVIKTGWQAAEFAETRDLKPRKLRKLRKL
jgi:hypothetical protein